MNFDTYAFASSWRTGTTQILLWAVSRRERKLPRFMPQVQILLGARVIVHSFVDGSRVGWLRSRDTETDALAHALWLERRGLKEQADEYLEDYLQRMSGSTRH